MNNGKICIAISANTASEMLEAAHRAEAEADIIELRFDSLRPDEVHLAEVMIREASLLRPTILTYRSPEQGGPPGLTREDRIAFWSRADIGEWARDLEEDILADARKGATIVSFHDFPGTADIEQVIDRMSKSDADILKIAATAHDICDALPVWSMLRQTPPNGAQSIPIAMGTAGKWTRILGLAHGAFLTYASPESGSETADGQITAADLINIYRVKDLNRETRVYGVIGDPVSSSLSTYMHNPAFSQARLNAVFIPLQVKDLDQFMRRIVLPATREVELNFAGFSVTMPHKQAVQKYLTQIDPIAQKIGAVNTIHIEGDQLTGYNTDAPGFIAPLKQHFPDIKGSNVAILGAGGAARAVIHALQQEQANITLFARNLKNAQALADDFNVRVEELSSARIKHDILVNATPLGMRGPNKDLIPVSTDQIQGAKFIYDLVTRPDETPLLREAKKAGIPAIGGLEMLIAQGMRQFEIWTGSQPPADIMRDALFNHLRRDP